MFSEKFFNSVWYYGSRNINNKVLSDYFNGFRLYLKPYKTGFKFYVAVRRFKAHGISDDLSQGTPVAYFKDCSLEEAKVLGLKHFLWMTV